MIVADLSMAWPSLTGAALRNAGFGGVIGYAGCDYGPKNVSRARFQDWLASGLKVGLVVENGASDLAKGAREGARQGANLKRAADALGYDSQNCVLFASGDWNASQAQADGPVVDFMRAFGQHIPIPGLYGNTRSIDACHDAGLIRHGWQSESTFGEKNWRPSAQSCLRQHYGDPRSRGLALDVNDMIDLSHGNGLMPLDVPPVPPPVTSDPIEALLMSVTAVVFVKSTADPTGRVYACHMLSGVRYWVESVAQLADIQSRLAMYGVPFVATVEAVDDLGAFGVEIVAPAPDDKLPAAPSR